MADFIPFENVAEVVLYQNMGNQNLASVHNFEFPDALTISILEGLVDVVIAAWSSTLANVLSDAINLISVKATDLTTASSPASTDFAAPATNGNISELPTMNNVALVLSEGTAARGRSYRGRVYQAGMPRGALVDSVQVSETYQGQFLAAFIDFFDEIETESECVHVVASRRTGGAPRVTGVATPITTYSANRALDSQRRRLLGRGS